MHERARDAVTRHNTSETQATMLLRLGTTQRDVAEGRVYALGRAVETHRRAVALFERVLPSPHHATLTARQVLAETLAQASQLDDARDELRAILEHAPTRAAAREALAALDAR